jgi:hypothetical protein
MLKTKLLVILKVFEVTPSLYMVELRKSNGDTLEFHKFYHNISNGLKDVMWKPEGSIVVEGDEARHRK